MQPEKRYFIRGGDFKRELPNVIKDYFRLPSYMGSDKLFEQQTATQLIKSPSAEMYYQLVKNTAWKSAKEQGNYPEAINIVKTNLEHLKQEGFDRHDSRAITIFFLRRLGRIYEHWATFGEKDKPTEDAEKRGHFLLAAYYYMLGDLELGVMTEFASRIGESLRGMGLFGKAINFDKSFWGANIILMGDDEVSKLRGKRSGNVNVVQKSGGAIVEEWLGENSDILNDLQ